MNAGTLTIGAAARAAGVNVETIRYYQRRGLLQEPPKPPGGVRHYTEAAVRRIQFVRRAQKLGFTLDEIAQLLRLDDGMHCQEAHDLAKIKLDAIQSRMADLALMRDALAELIVRCETATGQTQCPVIVALTSSRGPL